MAGAKNHKLTSTPCLRNRVFCFLILVLAAACAPSAAGGPTRAPSPAPTQSPISLTDGLNNTLVLEHPARRVVSLAPSNTEILFAVGAGDQVVGRDSISDYPDRAKTLSDVGGGFGAINTERIVSLKPDLILATEITPPDQVTALQDLHLNVFYLKNPLSLDDMYHNLATVARLTGHEAETDRLIQSLKARVSAVTAKTSTLQERPTVFYELDSIDPNAPWTSGPGTFIDVLLTQAGGKNLGNSLGSAWGQMSVEKLLTENPDYILLGDFTYGGVTPQQVAARPGWQKLGAVQAQRVFTFDDNLVSRPGPRLVDGLEALAKLLHPDLFKTTP